MSFTSGLLSVVQERFRQRAARYAELDAQLLDAAVVADPARTARIAREHGQLKRSAELDSQLRRLLAAITEAETLAGASGDADLREMAVAELLELRRQLDELVNQATDEMLAGEEVSAGSLLLEIRAGTGGDEAAIFAGDLFEMYRRFADARRWNLELLSASEGDAGGYREVIARLSGATVWQELAFESGGHRVQRVPTTETQGRIHTSAATVVVMPEPEETDIQVRWDDPKVIKEEAMRSSGPGGQNVNKVNSAVRLTHLETGIVVHIQGRDWHKNRAEARRVMLTRLHEHHESRRRAARDQNRRTLMGTGDRSERIRTYNFPQNRCTDHRINRNFAADRVIIGELDELVAAMREFDRQERLRQLSA